MINIIRNYIFLIILLSGCASITTGNNQSISVKTDPETGAYCELTNDKGTWFITNTPGSVVINRAWGDLVVKCTKGDKSNIVKFKSSMKAMNAGNLLCGGVIGLAVDAGTGSGYDYPSIIHVPLN